MVIGFSEETINPIVGTWSKVKRAIKDDDEIVFDSYKAYVKLLGDVYKSKLSPTIEEYDEETSLLLNKDNTGQLITKISINGKNSSLDWKAKTWAEQKAPHKIVNFAYTDNNEIIIDQDNIYKFSTYNLKEDIMQLKMEYVNDGLLISGLYSKELGNE